MNTAMTTEITWINQGLPANFNPEQSQRVRQMHDRLSERSGLSRRTYAASLAEHRDQRPAAPDLDGPRMELD